MKIKYIKIEMNTYRDNIYIMMHKKHLLGF